MKNLIINILAHAFTVVGFAVAIFILFPVYAVLFTINYFIWKVFE